MTDEVPPEAKRTLFTPAMIIAVGVLVFLVFVGAGLAVRLTDDDPSEVATTTTSTTVADDSALPPDESSLEPGQVLYQGTSGDDIGPIATDGMNRFLAIDHPGVAVGEAAGTAIATPWTTAGHVVAFGATLNTDTNNGRYGAAVYRNVAGTPPTSTPSGKPDSPYRAGCPIEKGTTSCHNAAVGTALAPGDKLTIIIGEEGNTNATGDYTLDWWFVFQPD